MKNIILIAIVGIVFAIGFGVTSIGEKSSRPLSLCDISLNPSEYDDQIIKIEATLYCSPTGVMHLNGGECGLRSDAWATLEFDQAFLQTGISQLLIERMKEINYPDEYKKVEVLLTGRFEDLERACFAPRFIVYATELKQVSEISGGTIRDALEGE